jgi:hypothetical protein
MHADDDDENRAMDEDDENMLNGGYVMTPNQMRNIPNAGPHDTIALDEDSDEEEAAVVNPEPENQRGRDLDLAELLNDVIALKLTQYAYLDTNGKIGGVSSGPPLLQFSEDYDEEINVYTRSILPGRGHREIAGGNIYMPAMLQLLNVNQRKGLDDLRGFPMLMLRTLLTRSGSIDSDKIELYRDLIRMYGLISVLISDCKKNLRTLSSHSVRVELYFSSTLQPEVCDIKFPPVPWSSFLGTIDRRELQRNWIETLNAFNEPLKKVITGTLFD